MNGSLLHQADHRHMAPGAAIGTSEATKFCEVKHFLRKSKAQILKKLTTFSINAKLRQKIVDPFFVDLLP